MQTKLHEATKLKSKTKKSNKLLSSILHTNGKTQNPQNRIVLLSTFFFILIGVYFFSIFHNDFEKFNAFLKESTLGFTFIAIATTLFAYKVLFFIYTAYNYIKYKPVASVTDNKLPTCTVIVPAYNEGKQVWHTLMSLAKSNYPEHKLQLLAIDDGSLDDTWKWMLDAKEKLGNRLEILKQPKNKGKRHALYRGFNIGTGEIFITVDSDSIVTEDTLRNLVSPFVNNPQCGAVAGNIRVLNNKKEMLPKMLDVSFVMSFEFVRSAESNLNSVLCTPGALAAYRSTAVAKCLPQWINQTFMGTPSDIGEDRAMTNMILKQGEHVLFQKNAVAYTNVPEEYLGLYKMFIRWGRSNVRENLEMAKYVFTNFRSGKKIGTRLLFISHSARLIMSYPFLFFMLFFVLTHPLLFLGSTLVSILILSTFSLAFFTNRYKSTQGFWAYPYSILYTFGLFWITPYAIATASRSGWLTRGLPEKK
ncbi:glycosyltransferase family 2 protein [Lacinutrix sp. C3R15]|uniref:glycosyltransferase family 2 protein n=1 Tax=Flavobacteriaceae TaxID=49546 RepID=UPI001C0918D6|nr:MULTISPECIES: glycosyltransferase [Flavobacteriaceae]MBU2939249.1 glycosyltransferase family 2 protein [Lacinutrix sp. C3R15]MDO6622564.1 glycosyltransferase [Oceanihabitans sp. 1_MG-2023]